jgi:hypothetical protein
MTAIMAKDLIADYLRRRSVMTATIKLTIVKTVHTAIWVFYNAVLLYMAWAVTVDRIDKWFWICLALIIIECLILLRFNQICPITLVARKYSDSTRHNFDIYLPEWLAKYNKTIYSIILIIILSFLVYRLLT